MRIDDLLLEQVLLVEEEDDGRVLEPRVRDDGAEQSLRLLHPVLVVRFKQNLVVLACNTPAMTRLNKKTIFNKEWNPPPKKKRVNPYTTYTDTTEPQKISQHCGKTQENSVKQVLT